MSCFQQPQLSSPTVNWAGPSSWCLIIRSSFRMREVGERLGGRFSLAWFVQGIADLREKVPLSLLLRGVGWGQTFYWNIQTSLPDNKARVRPVEERTALLDHKKGGQEPKLKDYSGPFPVVLPREEKHLGEVPPLLYSHRINLFLPPVRSGPSQVWWRQPAQPFAQHQPVPLSLIFSVRRPHSTAMANASQILTIHFT